MLRKGDLVGYEAFIGSTWNQRLEWLHAVNRRYHLGGWLNAITGIVRYFRNSKLLSQTKWAHDADAVVLWDISVGLKATINHQPPGSGDAWQAFFKQLFESQNLAHGSPGTLMASQVDLLKAAWGRAEAHGVTTGSEWATLLQDGLSPHQQAVVAAFITTGNIYRDALVDNSPILIPGFTGGNELTPAEIEPRLWNPDPRYDGHRVYSFARDVETVVNDLWEIVGALP